KVGERKVRPGVRRVFGFLKLNCHSISCFDCVYMLLWMCESRQDMFCFQLAREQNANVAHVCSSRSGGNHIAQRYKERIRIAASQKILNVESNRSCAIDCRAIDHCARGGTVAIYAVCSRAEGGSDRQT